MTLTNPDNGRWQYIAIDRDLYGQPIVLTRWGSRNRRGFRTKCYPVSTPAEAERQHRRIVQRRLRHGYVPDPASDSEGEFAHHVR